MCWDNFPSAKMTGNSLFQCRTRHYVCRDLFENIAEMIVAKFQCRTQRYVCRDAKAIALNLYKAGFNAARGIMCVGTAGALPISFFSMIAHASFFFNDVFGGGWDYGILASPARAGERSTSSNHTSPFGLCSWEVFPYDLLPAQLRPSGLLLGQVSKWRTQ